MLGFFQDLLNRSVRSKTKFEKNSISNSFMIYESAFDAVVYANAGIWHWKMLETWFVTIRHIDFNDYMTLWYNERREINETFDE